MTIKTGSTEHFVELVRTALNGARLGWVKGLGALDGTGNAWAQEARAALDEFDRQRAQAAVAGEDLPDGFPETPHWPRHCSCGLKLDEAMWKALPLVGYVGAFKAHGERYAVELRNCSACRSTRGIEVKVEMTKPAPATPPPQPKPARLSHDAKDPNGCARWPPDHDGDCVPWPF
jgi:hypothetical protein